MCTIGAVISEGPEGHPLLIGFKNADSPPVQYWHDRVGVDGGHASLAYGILPQFGINAGLNERGLLLISSYFDYSDPAKENHTDRDAASYWSEDQRGRLQEEVLATMDSAEEACEFLTARLGGTGPYSTGGSHIIADQSGKLFAFEHCRGVTFTEDATARRWVARSNQAFGLFMNKQNELSGSLRADREARYLAASATLSRLAEESAMEENIIKDIKQMLCTHEGDGSHTGSICAHGVLYGRSNAILPHHTLSSLIWNVSRREMHYTEGNPCQNVWQRLCFEESGVSNGSAR